MARSCRPCRGRGEPLGVIGATEGSGRGPWGSAHGIQCAVLPCPQRAVLHGARCTALGAWCCTAPHGAQPVLHSPQCCTPLGAHLCMLLSSWRCVASLHASHCLASAPSRDTGCCSRMLAVSCFPSKAPRWQHFPVALSAPAAAAGAHPCTRVGRACGCVHRQGAMRRWHVCKCGCNTSLWLQTGVGACT